MITFHGASEKLTNEVLVLKSRYSDYIDISDFNTKTREKKLKTITIYDGVPVILKYYNFDTNFRLEIGSYLSNIITSADYIYVEII